VGLDLERLKQARVEAVRALSDMARDALPDGEDLTLPANVRDNS